MTVLTHGVVASLPALPALTLVVGRFLVPCVWRGC
jgi:hypothetical protein